ncbi:hypothetical protein [Polymorphospora rubra]|nr:hypothetical protein [Polymorphospora rubra]
MLLIAADCQAAGVLADADRAADHHRQPEAAGGLGRRWRADADAAGTVGHRADLACVATVFPRHGRQLGDEIAAMAAPLRDTQPGSYLQLAQAMVRADED